MTKVLALLFTLLVTAALTGTVYAQSNGNATYSTAALTNTAQTVKSAAGQLVWLNCSNPNNAQTYVQVYDSSSAVSVGVTAPKISVPLGVVSGTPQTVWLAISMFRAIKVAATTTPTGGTAPAIAAVCNFGFQ